ncbi:MAG: hypothetical protein OXO49_02095 [Gammaproteobacteria bacterium]|nr:hypothetical protein [Gammaproteobacteria bacterium]MDE0251296.1 hypothetical protein [Gammaproteobacteria bacterium]
MNLLGNSTEVWDPFGQFTTFISTTEFIVYRILADHPSRTVKIFSTFIYVDNELT